MKHADEKDKKDESYYVGLGESTVVRRSVLEAARAVVQTVSQHHKIRDIQEKKLRFRTDLAHLVRQLREDLHKLENALPEPRGQVPDLPEISIVTRRHPMADHRLDKIESALNEIEQRMRTL